MSSICWVLVGLSTVFGQTPDLTYSDLKPAIHNYRFPVFSSQINPDAIAKINLSLQLICLEHLIGNPRKKPFETVGRDLDNWGPHTNFDDYLVHPTNHSILSIDIIGSGVGASSTDFSWAFNYDLQSGNPIILSDLFTSQGYATLIEQMAQQNLKRYQDFVKQTIKARKKHAKDERYIYLDEQIDMYKYYTTTEGMEIDEFRFSNDSIHFTMVSDAPRYRRDIDDLGNFYMSFSFAELALYTSPYGHALFNNTPYSFSSMELNGRFLNGKLKDGNLFTLFFKQLYDDGSFSAYAWFASGMNPVKLSGSMGEKSLEAVQYVYPENGDRFIGLRLDGVWEDEKTLVAYLYGKPEIAVLLVVY